MSDNFEITAGSGVTMRTDDIGGVQYPVSKIALGADGALDTLLDSGQQTMANSVPVVIASDQSAIPVSGSLTVGSITAGDNVIGRVKISDGTDLALVTASGEQNVLATAQPGVDIGDVTINNSTGGSAVNIQDGGNTITVDGAVTVSATDLDIRNLSQTQDSVLMYGSDDGGTTKRVVKTDSGGAIQIDLETANVTNTGTFVVQENGAALTALQLIDDAVYTDGTGTPSKAIAIAGTDGTNPQIIKVDSTGSVQVDVESSALPSGASTLAEQQAQTTLLGTIDADTSTVAGAVAGSEMQVDVVASLPAGNNNIGDVDIASSVLPSGAATSAKQDTIIGHLDGVEGILTTIDGDTGIIAGAVSGTEMQVDVLTMPIVAVTQSGTWDEVGINDSGNSITIDNAQLSVVGGGTEAAAMRVTIANDSTGLLSVDDNGGALTVDYATTGSGTATGAIRVELPTNGTGVIATVGAVTAITNALPAGTNAIGKLAANSAVDIGDVDVTSVVPGTAATNLGKAEDAGHTTADVGVMALGVRTDSPNAVAAGTTADYSFLATDMAGGLRTALYETDFAVLGTKHVKKYYANTGAVTDGIVWSPAAGTRFYITDIFIAISAAADVTLEDDLAGGDVVLWKASLAANSGWSHSFHTPLFSGEDAADLIITTSAGNVTVTVTGYEI